MKLKARYLKYIFVIIYGLIISSGPVCMAYLTAPREIGYSILWLMLPYSLLIYAGVYLTTKVFYSRFIIRGRYVSFFICVWLMAYLTDLSAFYLEYSFRLLNGIPQVIQHPFSPWVFLYAIPSSTLFVLTVEGFLIWQFYDNNRKQNAYERAYKKEIEEKTTIFLNRIKMPEIKRKLNDIISIVNVDPEKANQQIRALSDFLRHSLYEVSECRQSSLPALPADMQWASTSSWSANFISRKRFRFKRHLLLLFVVATICFGLTYDFPDQPVFDLPHIRYAAVFFVIIVSLIYINLYLILPLFLKRERQKLYAYILAGLMAGLFLLLNFITFYHGDLRNIHGIEMPWFLVPFGIAGNFLTFLLLLAGTSSVALLKRNILGKWRLSRLEAERAEIEFDNLQQQINPHTLFNLLNNIGILSYEEPEEAIVTLKSLEGFLDHILADSSRRETAIKDEILFINNYLTMEKSSGKSLEVEIICPETLLPLRIPSLLLIPFVENAIKHSSPVSDNRFIEIRFSKEGDSFLFKCMNPYSTNEHEQSPARQQSKPGGLGINNTRRRLELLYGNNFKLTSTKTDLLFTITLKLPIKNEMYNS